MPLSRCLQENLRTCDTEARVTRKLLADPNLHIRTRRVFDWLELAVSRNSGWNLIATVTTDLLCPIPPPRPIELLGAPEPGLRVLRLPGVRPVAVFWPQAGFLGRARDDGPPPAVRSATGQSEAAVGAAEPHANRQPTHASPCSEQITEHASSDRLQGHQRLPVSPGTSVSARLCFFWRRL